jgi:hypothetical protein
MVGVLSNIEPDICILHLAQGVEYLWRNDFETALVEFDQAIAMRDHPMARWNRTLTLLAMGRYVEGFADMHTRRPYFRTPAHTGVPEWHGEDIRGKRLLVMHEAGFGDTIMFLRYVPMLTAMGIYVRLDVPPPLSRLMAQLAPVEPESEVDYYVATFDLPACLRQSIEAIPQPPYLQPHALVRAQWAQRIGNGAKKKIGVAWSSNTSHIGEHANGERSIDAVQFRALLDAPDCAVFSLQAHDREAAAQVGITAFEFADFAALASLMDEIVSIDTAALHIAGAIGHPNICAMLPFAKTWRWHNGSPWYPQMKLCEQTSVGDWPSAFAQRRT